MDFYKSDCLLFTHLGLQISSVSRVSIAIRCQQTCLNYLISPNWASMMLTPGLDFLSMNSWWTVLSSIAKDAWSSLRDRKMSILHTRQMWRRVMTVIRSDRNTSDLKQADPCPAWTTVSSSSPPFLISCHVWDMPLQPRPSFSVC